MMITIRRFLRRVWPRSPLVVPALLLLVILIVSNPLSVPDWIRRRLYSIPANRLVEPVWVEGVGWPTVEPDASTLVHSIWGTRTVKLTGQKAAKDGDVRLFERESCQPVFVDVAEQVTLARGLSIKPLFLVVGSGEEPSPKDPDIVFAHDFEYYDLSEGRLLNCKEANVLFPWIMDCESEVGPQNATGYVIVVLGIEMPEASAISSMEVQLLDAMTGRSLASDTRPQHGNHHGESTVTCRFIYDGKLPSRAILALDIIGGSWEEAFDAAPEPRNKKTRHPSQKIDGPQIVRVRKGGGKERPWTRVELMTLPDDFSGIEVQSKSENTLHRVMRSSSASIIETFELPVLSSDFVDIRFLYRPVRHRVVFRIGDRFRIAGNGTIPEDWADYVIPADARYLGPRRSEAHLVRGMGEAFETPFQDGNASDFDWMSVRGMSTRDALNSYFEQNPLAEIWQTASDVDLHAPGDAYRAQFPMLSKWPQCGSYPALIRTFSGVLFLATLLLGLVRGFIERKAMRFKGYVELGLIRFLLLYGELGSSIAMLPTRDEAGVLPGVNPASWRSLRRLLKQRMDVT